ncbi:hypothetical protein HAX54_002083 [Datura stramonium]|uniref:Uncharacterized protein n=1 Tax=Datura stramonium TaxID=4076 RepID=A0ABS8T5M3_DATST|nr:hypothetical protein [Datura stramonium]
MVACDVPFDPLRVNDALGRGRKKRRETSNNEGTRAEGPVEPVHPDLLVCLSISRERKRGFSRPLPGDRMPQVAKEDIPAFSFLSEFEDEKANNLSGGNDDASS